MEVDNAPGPGPSSTAAQTAANALQPQRARERQPMQLRTLVSELSFLSRPDGSAKWSQDGSSVAAAVHGPRLAAPRKEDAEKAVVEVVYKPRAGIQGHREREYEHIIWRTLEGVILLGLHPRTSIMVVLQEVLCDGSMLSCALNAACAALVDAGVPMSSMLSSVTCAITQQGTLLLDPDSLEEQSAELMVAMAFAHHSSIQGHGDKKAEAPAGPSSQQQQQLQAGAIKVGSGALMCHTWPGSSTSSSGSTAGIQMDTLLDSFDLCAVGCGKVAEFLRSALTKALAT